MASSFRATPKPTRPPARRTPAVTTRRWRGCSAPPSASRRRRRWSTWRDAWPSSPSPPRKAAISSGGSSKCEPDASSSSAASELLRLGHLDDVDLAMMIHTTPRAEDGAVAIPRSNNGRFGKTVRFVGKAAHAGAAPHTGVNALYAAHIALMGINAIRETFRDEDTVRVHPILTHGGSQVNVIPGEARLETYVRGRTLEAIREANTRVDRALRAGALALGATVEIETLPGYLPLTCDPTMASVFKVNAETMFGAGACRDAGHRAGSTDIGDMSHVMPVLHPYMGGARGTGHAADYAIADPHMAYVMPARALAAMVVDLLWDGAGRAREVVATAKPALTRDAYVKFQRDIRKREVYES